jgi:hypothetical protein
MKESRYINTTDAKELLNLNLRADCDMEKLKREMG